MTNQEACINQVSTGSPESGLLGRTAPAHVPVLCSGEAVSERYSCKSAGSSWAVMRGGAARPHRAARQLFLLLIVTAAAALTLQEHELFNRKLEQLYGRKELRKEVNGQVFVDPQTEEAQELEKEHYGRLHAKYPVRQCSW